MVIVLTGEVPQARQQKALFVGDRATRGGSTSGIRRGRRLVCCASAAGVVSDLGGALTW